MKDLGVRHGCVECYLDDEELELLGASWLGYSRAAEEVGLDILRIHIEQYLHPRALSWRCWPHGPRSVLLGTQAWFV